MTAGRPPTRIGRWFSDLSLHLKLGASFGALIILGSLIVALIVVALVNFRSANEWAQHSLTSVALANEWNASLLRAQTAYRGYLLTGDPVFLETYETSRAEYNRLFEQLEAGEQGHGPVQAERWRSIQAAVETRQQEVTEPGIALRQQVDQGTATREDIEAYTARESDQAQLAVIRDTIAEVKRVEEVFLEQQMARAKTTVERLQRLIVLGALVTVVAGTALAFTLMRDLLQPISRLSQVAHEIADGQLDRRIRLNRGDELGEMAASFDRMADWLQAVVHDQQESLRLIQEHEGVVRAVMDGVSVGIMMVDSAARVAIVNQPACDLIGISAEELSAYSPTELQALLGRLFVDAERVETALGGDLFASDAKLTAVFDQETPEHRQLEVYSAPVSSQAGDRLGRIFALRDVTREREVDRMKTEFVSMVSHELRTPLTSIKGYVDLLREGEVGPLSPEQTAFLAIVASSTDRLVALINDLLDISRIESGKIELKRERLDLGEQIRTTAAAFRPQLASKQQALQLQLPPGPLPIVGDGDRITQILTNLLSNAHKYSPTGGEIGITAVVVGAPGEREAPGQPGQPEEPVEERVEVRVRDSGIGITAAEQGQLFTRFYRATNRVVQEAGGTGLGLTITRSLVELHGGTIGVRSVPGQGSTFSVSLPLAGGARGVGMAVGSGAEGRRILVVEDEPAIAGLLRRYLERAGHQVTIAGTAGEGLRQARGEQAQGIRPDLITLDVQLPDVDGFVLLEWLRDDPATRDIPVVLISISPDEGHGQQLGAIDHLTKPVDEATLLNRVGQILSRDGKFDILVADDDTETRRLIVKLLRRAGHRTIEASDGADAVRVAKHAAHLDLALIDVRMPGTDGLSALRALRGAAKTRDLPIVMMTASTGVESSRSDIEALGATLMPKPLAARELVDAISDALDRRVP